MNEQTLDLLYNFGGEIKEALSQVAQGLGVAAEHVYLVLLRQQVVLGVISLAWPILSIIIFLIVSKLYIRYLLKPAYKHEFSSEGDFFISIGAILLGIGWIVLLVHSVIAIMNGIGHLINPEYYALQQIIEFVDQIKNGTAPILSK